ncbi:RNA polymerase sigma factor [Anaeromyxobacter oryzae]|uniref:RNA polymerase sigma24 factor n=1 Tax=Anaeromyxobacter oryzae TaxID=2918170 RepID=A0ABM7X2R2_9BACT|nr:sigma-70 family RNA polymerase sigma factor [Anaeromyxobacter oryzae]BDG06077.1 RNA polymerase sigma24 factor [Anaeromyxobacter oryzae]
MQPGASRAVDVGTEAEARELAALRAGDEAAFLALVTRNHGPMVRLATTFVRSRGVAEEVVQETWIGVLKGLHQFEGRCSLRAWIYRILVNCAKSRAVREVRSVPMSALGRVDDEDGPAVPAERFRGESERWAGHWSEPPEPWPDARVESGEIAALVAAALETLPEAQRTVMSLRDVDGWEADEVCALLGITEGNQRVLLHRARSKVRAFVEEKVGREGRPS